MIRSPSKFWIEVQKGLLTPNEAREKMNMTKLGLIYPENEFVITELKPQTIRRAIACKNCGSTQYTNNICDFCGTLYEGGNG